MTSPIQQFSQDNPFAPKKEQGGFSADNPFAAKQQAEIDEQDPNPNFWERLGNHGKYIQSLVRKGYEDPTSFIPSLSKIRSTLGNLTDDIVSTGGMLAGKRPDEIGATLMAPVIDKRKEIFSAIKQNPLHVIPGLVEGGVEILEAPIRVITGTTNQLGQAVPSTPEQQADDIKTTVGIVLQGMVAGKVMAALSPELKGIAALNYASRNKVGNLAREVASASAAQAAGGIALGTAQGLGNEDMLADAIGMGLAFAPLGVVFGPLKGREIRKAANEYKATTPNITAESAAELAAYKTLQIDNNSSIADINNNIDAFATSDSRLEAAARANLTGGKGFIIGESVSNETVARIVEELQPSHRTHEGLYIPSEEIATRLDNLKPVTSGDAKFPIEFKDSFDKAVWIAAKDKKVMADLMEQTGLTKSEIESHKRELQKAVSEKAVNGNTRARSQIEIDQLNNQIILDGELKLASTPEGQTFKDATGITWTRNGQILTDGRQAIDVNSNLAKQIAGRDPKAAKPESPVIEVEKQNFDGNIGRNPIGFNLYVSDNGTKLLYPSLSPDGNPIRLNAPTEAFFKQTGFLPNEIVYQYGEPYIVKKGADGGLILESIKNKELTTPLDPALIVRDQTNLQSEFYTDAHGNQVGKVGVLTPESFFNTMWDKFRDQWLRDAEEGISYNDSIARFANKMGMKNQSDISLMQKSFYKHIQQEAMNVLPANERVRVDQIKEGIKNWEARRNIGLAQQVSNSLHGNGFYLQSEGAGTYTVRDIQSGKVLHSVKSLDEALQFTNLSGQSKGLELDGGDTNIIPPSAGSLGQQFQVAEQGNAAKKLDLMNTENPWLVPPRQEFKSMDNVAMLRGIETRFWEMHEGMQIATAHKRLFAQNQMRPFEKIFNDRVVKPLEKISPDRVNLISDYIESLALDERQVNLIEAPLATKIANAGITTDVVNFMKEVREGTDKPIGSPEFQMKLAEVSSKVMGKELQYSKEVVQAAQELFEITRRFPVEKVSPFRILRRAMGEEFPDAAISKKDYAIRNKLTKEEVAVGDAVMEILDGAYDAFGLNPQTKIVGYLPWAKIAEATGNRQWMSNTNTQFVRELNRLGVNMMSTGLERNPATLVRNYLIAGANTFKNIPAQQAFPLILSPKHAKAFEALGIKAGDRLSFNDVIKVAETYRDQLRMSGDRNLIIQSEAFNEHIADMKGIPNLSKRLKDAQDRQYEMLFGKSDYSLSKLALMVQHMAALGGRLGLSLRDLSNAVQGTYNRYGSELALRMAEVTITKERATELFNKGVFTTQTGLDLLMPGETFHEGMSKIAKATNLTMKYNGNILVHYQTIGGLYTATMEQVGRVSSKMLKNEVNKAKAYDELQLSVEDPIVQKIFNDLIEAGKTIEAGELLAKERVKNVIGIYGSHNNPRSWNSTFGSLAGAMGSWGANQVQTVASNTLRGSTKHRLASTARLMATNSAIALAGHYAGLNLVGWLISPFSLLSTSPLLNTTVAAGKGLNQIASNDSRQRDNALNELSRLVPHNDKTIAQLYLPYSFLIQDLVTGSTMMADDFGPSAAAKMIGVGVNKNDKSPLQDALGLHPHTTDSQGRKKYLK